MILSRALPALALMGLIAALTACGVDGPPIRPAALEPQPALPAHSAAPAPRHV